MRSSVRFTVTVGTPRSKWTAFFLCLFFGMFGAHKFYEDKVGMGILYIFTAGLFGIGWLIDLISLLFKPNPYSDNSFTQPKLHLHLTAFLL